MGPKELAVLSNLETTKISAGALLNFIIGRKKFIAQRGNNHYLDESSPLSADILDVHDGQNNILMNALNLPLSGKSDMEN